MSSITSLRSPYPDIPRVSNLPNPDQFRQSCVPQTSASPGCLPDRFVRSRISPVDYFPAGKHAWDVPLDLNADGQIVQNTVLGPMPIGYLDVQGNYYFKNAQNQIVQQGNMFLDQKLSVSAINKVTATVQNPFLKALQTTERNWAFQSSEIPLIQQHLTSQGLTGQGIKIGILDDLEDDVPEHTKTVTSAINDPRTGIAPQAAVTLMGGVKNFVSHAYPDDLEFYKRLKTDLLVWDFFQMAETINRAIAANDPQLRVLSLTQGIERNLSSFKLYEFLNEKNETGLYKKPRIRQALLGDTVLKGPDAQLERACQFTNQIFDSPQVTAARNSYLQATKNAAERGITIVASAGNSNRNVQPFAYPHVPGMELNEFAKSPDVICVAMSDSNQTPGFYADDRISRISSTGDGLHYNPTVSAPGQNIPFLQSSPKMAPNGVLIGTSYSTPYVAGLIALMLQQNPNLTFWDIKRKLQQTATLLPGYTVAEQGAGVVNPFKALGVSYY